MIYILNFLKKHWKELSLITLLLVNCFFWQKDHKNLLKIINETERIHQEEKTALIESYKNEASRISEVIKKYEKDMAILQKEKNDFIIELEKKKVVNEKEIVKMRRDDPQQLIIKIQTEFGFEYVDE